MSSRPIRSRQDQARVARRDPFRGGLWRRTRAVALIFGAESTEESVARFDQRALTRSHVTGALPLGTITQM